MRFPPADETGEDGLHHLRPAEVHRIDHLGRRRVLGEERAELYFGDAVENETEGL
jgi:hypothetical protein